MNLNLKIQKTIEDDIIGKSTYSSVSWWPSPVGIFEYIDNGTSIATNIKVLILWVKAIIFEKNWLGSDVPSYGHAKLESTWRPSAHCLTLWQCPRESCVHGSCGSVDLYFLAMVLACGGGNIGLFPSWWFSLSVVFHFSW
jgi:hypothetical protein